MPAFDETVMSSVTTDCSLGGALDPDSRAEVKITHTDAAKGAEDTSALTDKQTY